CNYQLIDTYTHQVQQNFWGYSCNQGYDACSVQRDNMNYSMNTYSYSCVETFSDRNYDFQTTTYDYSTYEDGQDTDDYDYNGCVDYDQATNTCYDQEQY